MGQAVDHATTDITFLGMQVSVKEQQQYGENSFQKAGLADKFVYFTDHFSGQRLCTVGRYTFADDPDDGFGI